MLVDAQKYERQKELMQALECEEEFYYEYRRNEANEPKSAAETACKSRTMGGNTKEETDDPSSSRTKEDAEAQFDTTPYTHMGGECSRM